MLSNEVWINVGLIVTVAVSWIALAMALACYLRLRKQAGLTQKLYQRLDHNLQVANSGSIGLGKRLIALEQQLLQAENQKLSSSEVCSVAEVASPASSSFIDEGLSAAANLLSAGVRPEEVARRCGISRAEASLMQLMHSQVSRTVAA